MYFDLSDQEESSFLVFRQFTSVEGGTRLVRFTDSSRGHAAALGRFDDRSGIYRSYWMYAQDVEDLLDQVAVAGPYGRRLIQEVSERWAISDDWGNLERAWVMTVPPGNKVDGYCGYAKFQPKISAEAQESTGRFTSNSYGGGYMQFVLGLTEEQRQWIRGPIPTLSLSRKRLRSDKAR